MRVLASHGGEAHCCFARTGGAAIEVRDIPSRTGAFEVPWEPLKIAPIGDIQYGAPGCDPVRLRKHIAWALEQDAWFLGTGDYTDFLSPSNRRYLKNSGLYDTAMNLIDDWHTQHVEEIKDILKPTIGRWIGLHEGHHYHEFTDGGTTDTRLCEFLKAPFLGTVAANRIRFVDKKKHRGVDALIWSTHGEGGGQANPFNRLLSVAPGFPQVDVFIQGHNTALGSRKFENVWFYGGPGDLKLRAKEQVLVLAGGFMRGYQQGSTVAGRAGGSYVERGLMRPTAIGGPLIELRPRHREEFDDLQIFTNV